MLEAKASLAAAHDAVRPDISQAITRFEQSRVQFERLGDMAEAAVAEIWAAQLLRDIGRIDEGRRRLRSIVELPGYKRFKVLQPTAYYWLAMGDFSQNEISVSHLHLRAGLREAELTNNFFEIQHLQDALTSGYTDLFELEPALLYAGKMTGDRGLYYQSRSQYWRDKGTLAELAVRLKYFSTALGYGKESLAAIKESDSASDQINDGLRDLISVTLAMGDQPAALAYANESLAIARSRELNAENARTIGGIHLLLGDIQRQAGDCPMALAEYDRALEQLGALPELADDQYQLHRGKLLCYSQLKAQAEFAAELKIVLGLSDRFRTTIREDSSRQAFFSSQQIVINVAAANALDQDDQAGAYALIESSRSRSLLEFAGSDQKIAEIEKNFGGYSRSLALAEIQVRLPPSVQLVQYAVLPDRLAIWVVTNSRFNFTERPISDADLEGKINRYQAALLAKTSAAELRPLATELYQLLLPADLESGKQLCLIPDGTLDQLAFASLVSPGGKYLVEDYALLSAPSASVMIAATDNARQKQSVTDERLLSVGDPDFDRVENPNLADLRAAQDEAKSVAQAYPGAQLHLGATATKERFLHDFTAAEVIHFAGHFVANRRSPGNSKLLFTGGDLRTSELGNYKLPSAKLVVLSACETGFERYDASEGAIGIARTFLALRAPVVVATQWKVDSEPTRDLMIDFHRNRKERGMVTAEALRQSQLTMLRRASTSAPFYWAAFTLFGGYANY